LFTGIIEEIGKVKSIRRGAKSVMLEIEAQTVLQGTQVGDSIATNGVCLTVTSMSSSDAPSHAVGAHSLSGNAPSLSGSAPSHAVGVPYLTGNASSLVGSDIIAAKTKTKTKATFTVDVMPETLNRTSLAQLQPGSLVNLERALSLQTRLGGHIVSGHIDGTGVIVSRTIDDTALWLWVECKPSIMRYIIEKGSITIQGVSLTVARVTESSFAVSLIPHTQGATTLHNVKVGDVVNLENDVIAKYVEKLMPNGSEPSSRSADEKIDLYRSFLMS
jgi:riboflavin synthase